MAIQRSKIWPPPVYVAKFRDGTECRLSCGDYRKGKAATGFDFDKGRRMACSVIGAERLREEYCMADRIDWHPDRMRALYQIAGPAKDIVSGHMEHDGAIIPDPHFEPAVVATKPKTSALDRLIASIRKLNAEDLLRLQNEIEMTFEAAE